MNVLRYLDSRETLQRFNLVCHKCQEAIDGTRINPCCGINSIQVALSIDTGKLLKIEKKIFKNLDTFEVHFRELEKMKVEDLEEYPLFEVYKYCMYNNENDYKVLKAIRDKVSIIGIDTNYNVKIGLATMKNLRKMTLRIGDNTVKEVLDDALLAIKSNRSLNTVIVWFKSSDIDLIIEKVVPYQKLKKIVFIISWFEDEDADKVRKLMPLVNGNIGIVDCHLDAFHDFFMFNESNVVIQPQIRNHFRYSEKMESDERFAKFKDYYYPEVEEKI